MKIKGTEVDINQLINELNIDTDFYIKRKNGIMLKDSQIQILERYQINYQNHSNLSSLLFEIEECLNELPDAEDLESLSIELSEVHYYNETNK